MVMPSSTEDPPTYVTAAVSVSLFPVGIYGPGLCITEVSLRSLGNAGPKDLTGESTFDRLNFVVVSAEGTLLLLILCVRIDLLIMEGIMFTVIMIESVVVHDCPSSPSVFPLCRQGMKGQKGRLPSGSELAFFFSRLSCFHCCSIAFINMNILSNAD